MTLTAKRLRALRKSCGESLQQAADGVGCAKTHLWELEAGRTDNPTINLLRSLAMHYDVTVAYLIGEKE